MGIKERKIREKENFRRLVIATAHEIMMKKGLDGLTMRAIAQTIEYSQSKIYEIFKSKDHLCEILCEEICEKLLEILRNVPKAKNPDQYLTDVILKTTEFHGVFPHSDTLFTLVCFGPERFRTPPAFIEIEKHFSMALRELKSPYLKTEKEILAALDIIRCIFIGVSNLMASETSLKGRTRALEMTENALKVLLRGWKG